MVQVNLGQALSRLKDDTSALAMFTEASKKFEAAGDREDFGETHIQIGRTFDEMGEHELGTVHLRQAVSEYGNALSVFTRTEFPFHWAETKGYLATALQHIGGREPGIESLTAAVKSYREALEVFTRADDLFEWSANESDLGMALTVMGSRDDSPS